MRLQHAERFECIRAPAWPHVAQELGEALGRPRQRELPAWFLYDDIGSRLFDHICRAPEYYPTRTELGLLEQVAPDIGRRCDANMLVELGAGMGRKTHLLLQALGAEKRVVRYAPLDVSEPALQEGGRALLPRYRRLLVTAVVGDFRRDLGLLPAGGRRLVAFLGGTIGNFDERDAAGLLADVAQRLGPDDHLLLGADLVKPRPMLHAAYNDAKGLTAAFNLNALARLQREHGAELPLDAFRHHAFFSEEHSRIEMHARAARPARLRAPALRVDAVLAPGESIRTEISRKFTPQALERMLRRAGLQVEEMYQAQIPYALALARRS